MTTFSDSRLDESRLSTTDDGVSDVDPPDVTFATLGVSPDLVAELSRSGIEAPFPVQSLTITPNADEAELRRQTTVPALNKNQSLFASGPLPQTRRIMVKDEDLCVHCGLCAERCPTGAWDMQKLELKIPKAGQASVQQAVPAAAAAGK